jgi:pimeloyl-ACP methyl ester carboxylesterase
VCLACCDALAAKHWPVASEERMAPTSYGETFVRITGPEDAPPLVLLPGAFGTSLLWAPNIQVLSQTCRCFAVDQVGEVGRSTCTRPIRRISDLMAWLDELLDALKLEDRVNLMGISYGGWLTAEYALHAPGRLNKAVLLAPGGTVLRISNAFIARAAWTVLSRGRGLRPMLRWLFADLVRTDPERWGVVEDGVVTMARTVQHRELPFPRVFTDAKWAGLHVPTLFLVGEHEGIYAADKAVRRLKRVAPQVQVQVVPGAGHDLTMAQAEMVDQVVLDFLAQQPVASKTT